MLLLLSLLLLLIPLLAHSGNTDGSEQDWRNMSRGAYQISLTPHVKLGVEGGYVDLGKGKYVATPIDWQQIQHGTDVLGVANYDFQNGLSLFGKAGGAKIIQNDSLNQDDWSNLNDIKPEVATGLAYQINPHVAGTLSISHIFSDDINQQIQGANPAPGTTVGLGIKFNF